MDFPEILPEHSKDYNDKQNCDRKFWYLNNKFFPTGGVHLYNMSHNTCEK